MMDRQAVIDLLTESVSVGEESIRLAESSPQPLSEESTRNLEILKAHVMGAKARLRLYELGEL
jgi:hypothetical protein